MIHKWISQLHSVIWKKVQPYCSWKIINKTWKLFNCNSVINVKSEPLQKHERYRDVRKLFLRFSQHGFFFFFNDALWKIMCLFHRYRFYFEGLRIPMFAPSFKFREWTSHQIYYFQCPKKQFLSPRTLSPTEITETPPEENCLHPKLSASIQRVTLNMLKKVWDKLSYHIHIFFCLYGSYIDHS